VLQYYANRLVSQVANWTLQAFHVTCILIVGLHLSWRHRGVTSRHVCRAHDVFDMRDDVFYDIHVINHESWFMLRGVYRDVYNIDLYSPNELADNNNNDNDNDNNNANVYMFCLTMTWLIMLYCSFRRWVAVIKFAADMSFIINQHHGDGTVYLTKISVMLIVFISEHVQVTWLGVAMQKCEAKFAVFDAVKIWLRKLHEMKLMKKSRKYPLCTLRCWQSCWSYKW